MKKQSKVVFVFSMLPHYRKSIINALLKNEKFISFFIFCDEDPRDIKKINVNTFENKFKDRFILTTNYWYDKRILFWQRNVVKNASLLNYDSIVFLGEMNILSTWVSSIIARFRRKKVFFGVMVFMEMKD